MNNFRNDGKLRKHVTICKFMNDTKIIFPNERQKILYFLICADFERILEPYSDLSKKNCNVENIKIMSRL